MMSRWKLEYDKDPESALKGNGILTRTLLAMKRRRD